MKLTAHGIETDLPPGWEGRISLRQPVAVSDRMATPAVESPGAPSVTPAEQSNPVAHVANFALPEARGDFGSGAVDVMGGGHVLIVLFEYGPESVGTALFRRQGLPAALRPSMFSGSALQRTLPGQAGCQVFFTAGNRPFCLYVVLGRQRDAADTVPLANRTLHATRISAR